MRSPRPCPPESTPLSWRDHVAAWQRSGQTAHDYADAHGLRAATLYSWRRRLRARSPPATASTPRLVPVTIEAPALCELVLRDGRVLRFPASLEPPQLAALVRALEAP